MRTLFTIGATLRLTRFVIVDDLGAMLIQEPIDRKLQHLADDATVSNEQWSLASRLREGLNCPYCIGFWIGLAVILSHPVARALRLGWAWNLIAGALSLNYLTANVGARLGDTLDEEEEE